MTPQGFADIRQKLRMSQADFAAALGQSNVTISRWETGWNGAEVPTPIARQVECLEQVFDRGVASAKFTPEEFVEGLKITGATGAIAAAAAAGLISRTVLSTLAVIPTFGWLGTVFGIGAACALPFFSKLREVAQARGASEAADADDREHEEHAGRSKKSTHGSDSTPRSVRRSTRKQRTLRKEKQK